MNTLTTSEADMAKKSPSKEVPSTRDMAGIYIPPEWKERALLKMRKMGMRMADLARLAGVSQPIVSRLLNTKHPTTIASPAAHKAAEILEEPLPNITGSELGNELVELAKKLKKIKETNPEGYATISRLVEISLKS